VAPYIDNRNVIYLGSVGPEKRNEILGGAYALLHPIHFDEPFGLSVIEAMACGTPVLAFNRGSMPEVVKNGQSGFLVNNVKEACPMIAAMAGIRREDCRRHVEKYFSRERMVDDYINIYKHLLKGNPLD